MAGLRALRPAGARLCIQDCLEIQSLGALSLASKFTWVNFVPYSLNRMFGNVGSVQNALLYEGRFREEYE